MVDPQAMALTYMMDGGKICQTLFLYHWPGAQALSASLKIGSKVQSEGRWEEAHFQGQETSFPDN